jgi:hypothetical protein
VDPLPTLPAQNSQWSPAPTKPSCSLAWGQEPWIFMRPSCRWSRDRWVSAAIRRSRVVAEAKIRAASPKDLSDLCMVNAETKLCNDLALPSQ